MLNTITLILLVTLLLAIYAYVTRNFNYWKDRGVPYLKPVPFFGNVMDLLLMKKSVGDQMAGIYKGLSGQRFGGFFLGTTPCLMVRDPELMKHILVKDFAHFTDWSYRPDPVGDPLASNALFFMQGERWRFFRERVTKIFTLSRIKASFPHICDCALSMIGDIGEHKDSSGRIDIKQIAEAYPIYVIASFAFGVHGKLAVDARMLHMAKEVTKPALKRILACFLMLFAPYVLKHLRLSVLEESLIEDFRDLAREFLKVKGNSGISSKDFSDVYVQLRDEREKNRNMEGDVSPSDVDLSDEVLFGVAAGIIVAGYETTGNALAFCCYELMVNGHVQDTLRQEIDDYLEECHGKLSYEGVQKLTEMDKVVSEVVRKYPSVNFITRRCNKDYRLPGEGVTIEEGSHVYLSVHGLHRDPEFYPDPDKFDPERFSEENRKSRESFTYLPFGAGPRMCVGMQLSLLELKVALVYTLSHFELHPCKGTPKEVGLHPKGLFALPDKPLWLQLVSRKDNRRPATI